MHLNSSFNVGNSISKQNKENLNKTTNENGNFKDISYSPITHRFNQNYENFLNRKPITERKENTLINLSHFDEFNVKIFILFFFSHKYYPYYLLNPIQAKNNEFINNKIREKSQSRIDLSTKVSNKIYKNLDKSKEILQDVKHGFFEEKLTRDYVKEKAMLKSVQMEEVRKQIKFRDVKRNEINDYWEKNNKLIEKSYDDLNKTNNHDLFKDYKNRYSI